MIHNAMTTTQTRYWVVYKLNEEKVMAKERITNITLEGSLDHVQHRIRDFFDQLRMGNYRIVLPQNPYKIIEIWY